MKNLLNEEPISHNIIIQVKHVSSYEKIDKLFNEDENSMSILILVSLLRCCEASNSVAFFQIMF